MLTADSIKRFQEIFRNEFGVDITVEEATEHAQRLLNLTREVMKPIPKRYTERYREIYQTQVEKSH
jgi:aldehyde:ferredoxin oxidoreductase